jgi:hypothetical protein
VLNRLKFENPENAESEFVNAFKFMHNKSSEYNQEHPTGEMIANDIKILTEGAINLDLEWLKKVEAEHKSVSLHQKSKRQQRPQQRQQQKGVRKSGQRHNTQK